MRVQSDLNREQIQFLKEIAECGVLAGCGRYEGVSEDKGYFYIMSGEFVHVHFRNKKVKDYSSSHIRVKYLMTRNYVKWVNNNIYQITSKGRQAVGLTP